MSPPIILPPPAVAEISLKDRTRIEPAFRFELPVAAFSPLDEASTPPIPRPVEKLTDPDVPVSMLGLRTSMFPETRPPVDPPLLICTDP